MSGAQTGRRLLMVAVVFVVGALTAGLWMIGSPSAQRAARTDERRERDLDTITIEVDSYHGREGRLPETLAQLASRPGQRLAIVDPVDASPYDYTTTGADRYRLCARFATDTSETTAGRRHVGDREWLHAAGRTCFDHVVDPKNAY